MDTSLEILNRTPSPQKKTKQMTLFQFGSKGGFSLSCTQKRKLSPQFDKENSKPKARSRSLSKKNNKENMSDIECLTIDKEETSKLTQKKLILTDKTGIEANSSNLAENKQNDNQKTKPPKAKESTVKQNKDTKIDISDDAIIE